jgi:hypothetical protein
MWARRGRKWNLAASTIEFARKCGHDEDGSGISPPRRWKLPYLWIHLHLPILLNLAVAFKDGLGVVAIVVIGIAASSGA